MFPLVLRELVSRFVGSFRYRHFVEQRSDPLVIGVQEPLGCCDHVLGYLAAKGGRRGARQATMLAPAPNLDAVTV